MLAATSQITVEESSETTSDLTLFRAEKEFEKLERWILSDEASFLPEHVIEAELEKKGREVYRLLLQTHLNQRGTGDVGEQIEVAQVSSETGEALKSSRKKRKDPKTITSIFGKVKANRAAYRTPGGKSMHPLDEDLGLPGRSFSYEVQRRVVSESVRGPFEEVVESLEQTTGNRLSKRSVEQIVREAATDFDAFYEQRAAPSAESTGSILVTSIDCKGVPMVKAEKSTHPVRLKPGEKKNKKKMATVSTVYTQSPRIRTPEEVLESLFDGKRAKGQKKARPECRRVWASLKKGKDEVIQQAKTEMEARDPEGIKIHVAVTDGERALQKRVKKYMPDALLVLDLIHILERLWVAGHALYKSGSTESIRWVRRHALMILRGQVSQVVKGMRQSATKRKLSKKKREAIHNAANYLYNNRAHMKYDEYLAAGLPIASGSVEGACKNLVKDRMERSGMRWTEQGAEAILKLRAIKLSGDLDVYWLFHVTEDQNRLHGSRKWRVIG